MQLTNNTNTEPSRNPDGTNNKSYVEQWKLRNPEKVRAINRRASALTRKKESWKEYLRNWRREWYLQGNNAYLQYLRSVPSCIRCMLKKGKGHNMTNDTRLILKNLYAIGWTLDTKLHINHKVSLPYLLEICPDLPKTIAYDKHNLELVTKAENHSLAKREVGRRTVEAAEAMENRYPVVLHGLVKLIKSKLGEMK